MPTYKVIQVTTYQNRIIALLDNGEIYWRKGIESCPWHKLDTLTELTDYIPEGLTEDTANHVDADADGNPGI